ncbi:MAG: Fic family protein [Akkermansiaceae bacterium]|nr:Fic family protein [Akkermansiaceae bacterium]
MDIEVSRQAVSSLPVTAQLLTSLRQSARLTSTHYSTQIEGNRLTEQEVAFVAKGGTFPNRKRDETEVKNYFLALDYLDELLSDSSPKLTPEIVQTIHGCVLHGKQKPTSYRDGQKATYDSGSRNLIYLPPEWRDVPTLIEEMVAWVNEQLAEAKLPAPMIAGIAHYQFATIHPYYDGNGRTARLLTNFILHLSGYGLKGIYSLEEYYARNLPNYYKAISVGDSHNYYESNRAEADISHWVEYFCQGMADAFANVHVQAEKLGTQPDQSKLLRELDIRQKRLLAAFRESRFLTTKVISSHLGVSPRTALNLCNTWVEKGFLIKEGERKSRRYELAPQWVELL